MGSPPGKLHSFRPPTMLQSHWETVVTAIYRPTLQLAEKWHLLHYNIDHLPRKRGKYIQRHLETNIFVTKLTHNMRKVKYLRCSQFCRWRVFKFYECVPPTSCALPCMPEFFIRSFPLLYVHYIREIKLFWDSFCFLLSFPYMRHKQCYFK